MLSIDTKTGIVPLSMGASHQEVKANALQRIAFGNLRKYAMPDEVEIIYGESLIRGYLVEVNVGGEQ